MSCNTTDDVRIIMKYSTISGATPSIPLSDNHEDGTWLPTDLYIGEFFTNAADDTFWIRTDNGINQLFGGTGGSASFIGDFVHISGGTFSGGVYAPTFSAQYLVGEIISGGTISSDYFIGTFSGDGSLLTGIVANWLGGTISNPSYFTNTVDFTNTISFDGLIQTNNTEFLFDNNININGYASASIFYGDGSGLTNLPTGTYSDTFTIGATLSSNTIIFSRNDGGDYDIDLSSILNQQAITTITWDDTIDELLVTFNDASTIGLTINNFSQVSSTGPITAPEFYGGIFYGEFVGTFSNDIYTTGATLSGTTAIFDRTDGVTYSLDLSSIAGGGGTGSAGTLEQTLALGNTTGVYDIIVDNSSEIVFGTSSGLLFNNTSRLREGTIDAGYGGNKGIAQICAVGYEMKWESGSLYIMNGDGTQIREVRYTFGATPSTSDDITKGFIVESRWILDNGDLYTCSDNATASAVWNLSSTGFGTLEQTLQTGNYIGTQSINFGGETNMYADEDGLGTHTFIVNALGATTSPGPYLGVDSYIKMTNDVDGVTLNASQNDGVIHKQNRIYTSVGSVGMLNQDFISGFTTQIDLSPDSMEITDAGNGFGLKYASDYSATYLDRSLVDKAYVDLHGATGLAGVLAIDNTTGTQSIFISSSASQIQGYNGINQHWYDAGAPFVGLGDYYQIENNSGGGETQSYIRFYDEGDTMIENNEKYDTINSPANQDAKKTRLWLRPQTIIFNADNQDFDTNTFNLGSEMTISADAFNHETHDILNDCTAQIVASTDGTGTFTAVSLQAYHYGGASASKVIVAHDYITNRVDANVGTGTGPFTLIEQTYTDIIVSGTPSFPGVTYDRDYSATFTNRSLVDKEYVDNAQAAGSFGITVDGGGSVITTGLKGFVIMPYSGTITEWTIIADQSGSSVVDIWKSTYASAPPTIANTITGSALPTLTTAQTAQSSTLTGWTTSVTTGDVIGFNVNSASSVTRLTLSIKITKS